MNTKQWDRDIERGIVTEELNRHIETAGDSVPHFLLSDIVRK